MFASYLGRDLFKLRGLFSLVAINGLLLYMVAETKFFSQGRTNVS